MTVRELFDKQRETEKTMKVGDLVIANWSAGSFGHYSGKGKIVKINEKSIVITLTEEIKKDGKVHYPIGHRINVPRIFNLNKWSGIENFYSESCGCKHKHGGTIKAQISDNSYPEAIYIAYNKNFTKPKSKSHIDQIKYTVVRNKASENLDNGKAEFDELFCAHIKNTYGHKFDDIKMGEGGGMSFGKRHSQCDDNGCGVKYQIGNTGKIVELEGAGVTLDEGGRLKAINGGEGVLKVDAMADTNEYIVKGKPREIASCLNELHGGVNFRGHNSPCEIVPVLGEGGEVHPINNDGGYDYSKKAKNIAKKVDLITLPKEVTGTNCSNCMYVKILDAKKGLGFCTNKEIQLPVTARMCCSLWDNSNASRSWNKMNDGGISGNDVPTFKSDAEIQNFIRLYFKQNYDLDVKVTRAIIKSDEEKFNPSIYYAVIPERRYGDSFSNEFRIKIMELIFPNVKLTSIYNVNETITKKGNPNIPQVKEDIINLSVADWSKVFSNNFIIDGVIMQEGGETKSPKIQHKIHSVEDVLFMDNFLKKYFEQEYNMDVNIERRPKMTYTDFSVTPINKLEQFPDKLLGVIQDKLMKYDSKFVNNYRITLSQDEWEVVLEDKMLMDDRIVDKFYKGGVPSAKKEIENIKKDAIKKGNWLKAPNGNDTRLDEDTWALVRTKAFKLWFGDWERDPKHSSKVIDYNGEPLIVYHGTIHKFTEFNLERANMDNDFGKGYYASNSFADVERNYASKEGKDLTTRIEVLAEKIENNEGISYARAKVKAKKELVGKQELIMPLFLNFRNPFIIDGEEGTFLDFDSGYDEETEEYSNQESGALVDFMQQIRYNANEKGYYGLDPEKIIGEILETAIDWDGVHAQKLIDILKNSEGLIYAEDNEGNLISNQFIGECIRDSGFDGIIDKSVSEKFRMMGLSSDTVHYITFNPFDLKSADKNKGTFSPETANIYMADGGGVEKYKSILDIPKKERIEFIKKVLKEDKEIISKDYHSLAIKTNKFIEDFFPFNKNNPIITEWGDKIYFEPYGHQIKKYGYIVAQIKYAVHFITVDTGLGKSRHYSYAKVNVLPFLMATLKNPDDKLNKKDTRHGAVFIKKINFADFCCSILTAELSGEGNLRAITMLSDKDGKYIAKRKASGIWMSDALFQAQIKKSSLDKQRPNSNDVHNEAESHNNNKDKNNPDNDQKFGKGGQMVFYGGIYSKGEIWGIIQVVPSKEEFLYFPLKDGFVPNDFVTEKITKKEFDELKKLEIMAKGGTISDKYIDIISNLFANGSDAVFMEDLKGIGFNPKKYETEYPDVLTIGNFQLYRNNFLDKRYFIKEMK